MLEQLNSRNGDEERGGGTRRSFLKSAALGAALPAVVTTARGESLFELSRPEEFFSRAYVRAERPGADRHDRHGDHRLHRHRDGAQGPGGRAGRGGRPVRGPAGPRQGAVRRPDRRLRRLSRDPGAQGRRRGPGLRSRPLAFADLDRRHEGGQGGLLREADGSAGRGGAGVIAAEKETGAVFQVGSQYASSLLYEKVRELISQGAIGTINSVEARYNRNSPIGAWQYTIADRRLAETVDWDRFLGRPRSGRSIPSASSAGGTTRTTARPSRATCSSTC